jgi:hypothetical protein
MTTPVQSCEVPVYEAGCADLSLVIGTQILNYATGDSLDRQTLSVDVVPNHGLDHYPFDTYTAEGTVKVWN